jgi:hypothetical protein
VAGVFVLALAKDFRTAPHEMKKLFRFRELTGR